MIGSIVGNYKVTEKLGEGGMGAVYRGVDLMLEREVAIKVLRPEFSRDPQVAERFRSEAVTLAKLNHPNIATLHSFFRQGDDFFMVMEFVRGETLDTIIKREGAMTPERALSLFCQALEGIGNAHEVGIIHRDIKPANMMLTQSGLLKVMDFGIARVLGTARMTRQGNIIGTIEYMSPEQVQGEETDARSDIYSLGILLYEMLTGCMPFSADSEFKVMMAQISEAPRPPREFAPGIPLPLEAAIMRALAKKPHARFQTAAEVRAALQAAVPGFVPVSVTPGERAVPVYAPPPGEAAKPTRLAPDSAGHAVPPPPVRETRLGQGDVYPQAPPSQHVAYAAPQSGGSGAIKWIIAAAAIVIVLAGVGIGVMLMDREGNTAQPPPQTEAPPPVAAPMQPAAPPPVQTQSQPAGGLETPVLEGVDESADAQKGKTQPGKPKRDATAAEKERQRRREAALKALDQ